MIDHAESVILGDAHRRLLARARVIDPEAFAAIDTPRHVATSARRISAIDQARAEGFSVFDAPDDLKSV